MKKKSGLLAAIGIIISAVCLYFAFSKVDFTEVWEVLKLTKFGWLILSVFIYLFSFFFRALRWKFILQSIKKCKVIDMFYVVCIAFMANNILPLRMGEFIGAYVNAKKHGISNSSSFATIVVSRVFDGISLLIFACLMTIYFALSGTLDERILNALKSAGPILILLFFGSLLFLFGMLNKRDFTIKTVKAIFFFIPEKIINKIIGIVDSFIGGLKVLHNPKDLFLTTMASLSIWFFEATTFYLVSVSLGLGISYPMAAFVMIVIAFGVLLPSSPSFIGVYEMACILGLSIFGISREVAVSYSLLIHTMQFIVIIALGLISLSREKLKLGELKKKI